MKQEILDILRIPAHWNYKIEKVTYAIFIIETAESYAKSVAELKSMEAQEKNTGRTLYGCDRGGIIDCGSVSIKVDISNYERIIEEKYEEFKIKYGGRLRSIHLE